MTTKKLTAPGPMSSGGKKPCCVSEAALSCLSGSTPFGCSFCEPGFDGCADVSPSLAFCGELALVGWVGPVEVFCNGSGFAGIVGLEAFGGFGRSAASES